MQSDGRPWGLLCRSGSMRSCVARNTSVPIYVHLNIYPGVRWSAVSGLENVGDGCESVAGLLPCWLVWPVSGR